MNFRAPWNWNNPEIEMMPFCNLNWLTIDWYFSAYGIPISLRARNKLRTYSSFEKWDIAEQRTLKQVENTRKVSFYLPMQHKYHWRLFLLCHRKLIFMKDFLKNTANSKHKSTEILVPRLSQSKVWKVWKLY